MRPGIHSSGQDDPVSSRCSPAPSNPRLPHQPLSRKSNHLAQQIGIRGFLHKRAEAHHRLSDVSHHGSEPIAPGAALTGRWRSELDFGPWRHQHCRPDAAFVTPIEILQYEALPRGATVDRGRTPGKLAPATFGRSANRRKRPVPQQRMEKALYYRPCMIRWARPNAPEGGSPWLHRYTAPRRTFLVAPPPRFWGCAF